MKVMQCPTTWSRPISIQSRVAYGINANICGDEGSRNAAPFTTNAPLRFTDRLIKPDRLFVISDLWGYTTNASLQWDRCVMSPAAGALLDYYDKSHYVKGENRSTGNGRLNFLFGDGRVAGIGKSEPDLVGSTSTGTVFTWVSYTTNAAQIFTSTW
jgi:prepilin-type processing-associated H-X9-DG protein